MFFAANLKITKRKISNHIMGIENHIVGVGFYTKRRLPVKHIGYTGLKHFGTAGYVSFTAI